MFTIASWNVNSLKVRLPHVLNWLSTHPIQVLALQETKTLDDNFPKVALEEAGYQVIFSGQPTYNGVAILTKLAAKDIIKANPLSAQDPQKRFLAVTINNIRIVNVYVPNGQSVDSEKYQYKLAWLQDLGDFLAEELKRYHYVIVLGDFNIAPEDRDVHDPKAWHGHVLVSQQERAAFNTLLGLGFKDSFRLFTPEPGHFSWWDYRQAAFRRNMGVRIDHILISSELVPFCKDSRIDKEPRKAIQPSDHVPVITRFEDC